MTRADILGTKFQDDTQAVLKDLQSKHPLFFDRFYDTKSTGRFGGKTKVFIPPRPGDFLVGHNGMASVLECKASEVHKTLRAGMSSLVADGQCAKMRMWIRSLNCGFFIFRNLMEDVIEVWDGEVVIEARTSGKPLPKEGQRLVTSGKNLEGALGNLFLGLPL